MEGMRTMGLGLHPFMAVERSSGLGFLLQTLLEEKAKNLGGPERNDLLEVLLHLFSDPPNHPHPILGNTKGPHP